MQNMKKVPERRTSDGTKTLFHNYITSSSRCLEGRDVHVELGKGGRIRGRIIATPENNCQMFRHYGVISGVHFTIKSCVQLENLT
ncbi:MAG: hypothetical protein GX256_03840 [Fretibacterium sp.]|nr:hypothetical protein [Fretibacterium sp.]